MNHSANGVIAVGAPNSEMRIANNRAAFEGRYLTELQNAITNFPDEYHFPIEQSFEIAERMMAAIYRKSANKDGRAIKATCKALGIKYTYAAINEFLGVE
jgi:hypothetical protein